MPGRLELDVLAGENCRVQGVFFRASTRQKAVELGVSGWVRNCADGDVEGVACGDETLLAAFRAWLADGPPMATVEKTDFKECNDGPFDTFEVR